MRLIFLSFNPCFNGFFFSISIVIGIKDKEVCFNPCFNGFFFSIKKRSPTEYYTQVSILVLMDSSFQSVRYAGVIGVWRVSILVLMDSSFQLETMHSIYYFIVVSILVLMDSSFQFKSNR